MQLKVMWPLLREVGDPMGLKLFLNFTCIEQLPDSFLSNVEMMPLGKPGTRSREIYPE